MARLKDIDELIELIDDDIASLDEDMPREGDSVCRCTLKMVKLYIKSLPTVEAVPIEDYQSMEQTVHKLTQAIAEAEPKHGRWKMVESGHYAVCTNCRRYWISIEDKYDYWFCPHCGADMRERSEDGR